MCVTAVGAASEAPEAQLNEREVLYAALLKSQVLDKHRQLVHLSHVCNLVLGGRRYLVVDVMELVKGAVTPRGVNRIVVLDPALAPVQSLEYTTQRPLFCEGNRLFVFGDITVGGVLPEGNVLTFSNDGKRVEVSTRDPNDLPVAATGTRTNAPQ